MGLYDNFPYTNKHELNTDWIVKKIGDIDRAEEASEASAAAAKASETAAALSQQAAANSQASAANSAESAQTNADRISDAADQIYENTERIDNILVQGTPTEGNAELIDIRVGADGITYSTAGQAVRGNDSFLQSQIDMLDESGPVEYIANNEVFPTSTQYYDAGWTFDFSQAVYFKITNNGSSAGYFRIGLFMDGVIKQDFTKYINPGESASGEIFYCNTPGAGGWYPDSYFTEHTWSLRPANPSQLPARLTMYTVNNENPIKPDSDYTNCILVSPAEKGSFKSIVDAVAYAKSKFDVVNNPVTIFIRAGLYTLSKTSSRVSIIDKGANKISIIGEAPGLVKIKLVNTPAVNNQMLNIGGECLIKNLELYNLWNNDGTTFSGSHNAYCIHNDTGYANNAAEYETIVEDCYLYSEAFCPVGAGLWKNQKQIYRNVTTVFKSLDAGYTQNGSLYVHGPQTDGQTGCSVLIEDCTIKAESGTYALYLPNTEHQPYYTDIPVTIKRTIGTTNGSNITNVSSATHDITSDSALNNVEAWNY